MLTEHFTRPSLEEMAKRAGRARKLLEIFAKHHDVELADIIGRSRLARHAAVRFQFIQFCRGEGIGPTTVARLLKRNVTTIGYHMGHAGKKDRRMLKALTAEREAANG